MSSSENDDEALVRAAVRAADPLRDVPVPPLGATPQQLRQRAAQQQRLTTFRWRRVYSTLGALVAVLTVTLVFGLLIPRPAGDADPWPTPAPNDRLAQMQLYALAETLQPSQTDSQTGAVTYIEVLRWQPVLPPTDDQLITRTLERSWRAADGSGRVVSYQRQGTADEVRQLGGARLDGEGTVTTRVSGPGQMPAYFGSPGAPPTTAWRLAARLMAVQCGKDLRLASPCPATSMGTGRADQLLDAIIELHQTEILDRSTRRALLTALGGLRGLHHQLPVTDPLGRPGLAIRYGASDASWSLLWDRATGELLAAERWTANGLRDHLVYVDRARTEQVGAAAIAGLRDGVKVLGP